MYFIDFVEARWYKLLISESYWACVRKIIVISECFGHKRKCTCKHTFLIFIILPRLLTVSSLEMLTPFHYYYTFLAALFLCTCPQLYFTVARCSSICIVNASNATNSFFCLQDSVSFYHQLWVSQHCFSLQLDWSVWP